MTENIERALESQQANRVEIVPRDEPLATPVITSNRRITDKPLYSVVEREHPEAGEVEQIVNNRYHSEKKIRRLLKEELTIFDWLKAKTWRIKRGIK